MTHVLAHLVQLDPLLADGGNALLAHEQARNLMPPEESIDDIDATGIGRVLRSRERRTSISLCEARWPTKSGEGSQKRPSKPGILLAESWNQFWNQWPFFLEPIE